MEHGWRRGQESQDPTPEEIAAACERIRQSWSAAERYKRAAWSYAQPIELTPLDDSHIDQD